MCDNVKSCSFMLVYRIEMNHLMMIYLVMPRGCIPHLDTCNSILHVLSSVSAASIPVRLNEYYMELFTTNIMGTYVIDEKLASLCSAQCWHWLVIRSYSSNSAWPLASVC